MKKVIILIAIVAICSSCQQSYVKNQSSGEIKGVIAISGAFALYPLTVQWAEEFKKLHPDVVIDISAGGAGKGMADVLSGMVDIAMFSREVQQPEKDKGAWKINVARDAVFPTVNKNNPALTEILKKGLTREQFREMYTSKKTLSWDKYLGLNKNVSVNVFTRSDACGAAATWASFMGLHQEDLTGTGVFGDPGIADAVKKDDLGVGYNNLVYIYDIETGGIIDGLAIIPVDMDGNRIIDEDENFYNTHAEVILAIKKNKYPSPPARNLYLVTKGKPEKTIIKEFLNFILTSGQNQIEDAGYIQPDSAMLVSEIEKLK